MTRHGKRPADIGVERTVRQRRVTKPAGQEPGHESVPGAKNIEHFDLAHRRGDTVIPAADSIGKHNTAKRPTFANKRGVRNRTCRLQRGNRVGGAAGDMPFLFGPDDQITMRQHRLEMGRDAITFGEAALPVVMTAKRPQVRAIIDIKGHLAARLPRKAHGGKAGARDTLGAEMCSGHKHRLCRSDEIRINIRLVYGHVSAVLAIENQWKLLAVSNAENDESGKTLGIGRDVTRIDAFADQLLADEAPHMFITNTRNQCRFQTEAGATDTDVGRGSANIFGKSGHVFQTPADLSPVQIHGRASNADHVQSRISHSWLPCHV